MTHGYDRRATYGRPGEAPERLHVARCSRLQVFAKVFLLRRSITASLPG